jgi:hypothetical protein
MIGFEHRHAGRRGEEEIAALDEVDVRLVAVDREQPADVADEVGAVEREVDVLRRGELLADTAGEARA